jgi:magnesium-transporting ATPase (P-type)
MENIMDTKQEAIEQLNEIHSSLVDKQKFMPYNYNVLILWGVISGFLFLTFESVSSIGIWYGVGLITFTILIGFLIEIYFIKKENKKYELEKFTKLQTFIETNYTFSTFFSTILTFVFISNQLGIYTYLSWMFMLGFSTFICGFVMNNKKFTLIALINIALALAIMTLSVVFTPLFFEPFIKYIATLFIGGGFIYLGITTKKEYQSV